MRSGKTYLDSVRGCTESPEILPALAEEVSQNHFSRLQ